jgi:hypothetical protein
MTPRVVVGMPLYGKVDPLTLMSLMTLLLGGWGTICRFIGHPFAYIDASRNEIVRQTLETEPDATHLQLLDQDMVWPDGMVTKLLSHEKPVALGDYFMKTPPHDRLAFDFIPDIRRRVHRLNALSRNELRVVGGGGLGAALVETRLLRRMRDHFKDERWFRSGESGEDIWFFDRCRHMKETVLLDTGVECGHITEDVIGRKHHEAFHPDKEYERQKAKDKPDERGAKSLLAP